MSDSLTGKPWAQAPWELVTAPITAQAFRTCMAIQLHRRPDGVAPFPSQARLARMMGVSVPTIKRAISELVEAGILVVVPRLINGKHSSSSYTIHIPKITGDPATKDQGSRVIPGPGITDDPAEVDFSVGDLSRDEASPRAARVRTVNDDLWDALSAATGIVPSTKNEKARFGRSVRELRDAGATPLEITVRWQRWTKKHRGEVVSASTERVLVEHWGELGGQQSAAAANVDCRVCHDSMPKSKMKEHLYDLHDIGLICTDCGQIIGEGETHKCKVQGSGS